MKIITTTIIHTHILYTYCFERYTYFKLHHNPQFEQYLKVHTKIENIKGSKGKLKIHSWVKRIAHSSTELSVGTICFLHHQQQPQRKSTATET